MAAGDSQKGAVVKDAVAVKELILGAYVLGAAAASTGFVYIRSSDGILRKVMVQA